MPRRNSLKMDNIPATPTDVLLLPGLLLLFGVVVYGAGVANGLRELTLPTYRWVGVFLIALAAIYGFLIVDRLFGVTGEFYRAMVQTRMVLYAHYAALALPLIALLAVPMAEAWFRRSQQDLR